MTARSARTMIAVTADRWRRGGGGSSLGFATSKRHLEPAYRLQTPSGWISTRQYFLFSRASSLILEPPA